MRVRLLPEAPIHAGMEQKRTIKERVQGMFPKIPDVGEITAMLDQRFEKLYTVLIEIRDILKRQEDGRSTGSP